MRDQWEKKKKSLIRLCSFAFFLIIYGFIAVRTMRWRTALWEGDSPLGYAPQKYELCEILINKKISELFNPRNGAFFFPSSTPIEVWSQLSEGPELHSTITSAILWSFKIPQLSQGGLIFMSNRRFIDRWHPSNLSSPVSSRPWFRSRAALGSLSCAFLFFKGAGVRSQSTAGSISLNCSATFQGTRCN